MGSMGARTAATAVAFLCVSAAVAAPLGTPSLAAGQNIKVENGEVTIPGFGAPVTVVRYTWRDSATYPRSVSLVPAGGTTGYAVQMTYTKNLGANTVVLNTDLNAPDGGFGYFVSHELFRNFSDGANTTIADKIGLEDDSPLGKGLASTSTAQSVGSAQAMHEFRLNYPRWATKALVDDPDAVVLSTNPADYEKLALPVVIRWHFVAGRDYPLWVVDYDLSQATKKVANDVRGPYGVMQFNEASGPDVTGLRWGDLQRFVPAADSGEFSTRAQAGTLTWTWNTDNTGRRYNVLSAGNYEFGLVDIVKADASKYADGYAFSRRQASPNKACAGGIFNSMPCDYEWPYQSFQYDAGPPARPKIAWGSSPYLGTGLTSVYTNDSLGNEYETLNGTGHIFYGVHIVMGMGGANAPLTLARAAQVETNPTLTLNISSGRGYFCEVLGTGITTSCNFASNTPFPPWSSIRITMIPNTGNFTGSWTGPCAGVTALTCTFTLDQSATVNGTTVFVAGNVAASPTALDFGGQSMATTSPAQAVTITNGTGNTVTVNSVTTTSGFDQANNCTTLAAGATCVVNVTFTPAVMAVPLNGTGAVTGTLTVATTAGTVQASLAGVAEKSFVTHYYRSILQRAPDAGGKAFWFNETTRVQQLGADINEVWFAMAIQFFGSVEYLNLGRDNAGFVTDLYRTFFNRSPDSAGFNFWMSNLQGGMPREVLLAEFLFSAEFVNRSQSVFGAVVVRAERNVVTDFYRGLLGRVPDDSGFAFWVQQFRNAQCSPNPPAAVVVSAEAISSQFAFSPEAAARARTNAQFVGDLYDAFLRRGGDLAGVQFWINSLNGGSLTRDQVRQQFRASPEFGNRVNAVVAQGC